MKQIFTFILLFFSVIVYSQTTYTSDFDNQDELSVTLSGFSPDDGNAGFPTSNNSVPSFGNPFNGAVLNNGSGTITTNSISTSGLSSFSFDLASLAGSSGNGAETSDNITVSVSIDGGISFSSEINITGAGNSQWTYTAMNSTASSDYDGDNTSTDFAPGGGGSRDDDGDGLNLVIVNNIPSGDIAIQISGLNNSGNEYWAIDNLVLTVDEGSTGLCPLSITDKLGICETETNGTDNYTAFYDFEGADPAATYTLIATDADDEFTQVGTIGGDDPNNVGSGTIEVTGISEGTDVRLKILDGVDCALDQVVESPICEATCISLVVDPAPVIACNAETSGTDTYSVNFEYENGGAGVDYTISVNAGEIIGDDPATDAQGEFLVDEIPEGTDLEVTFTSDECGTQVFNFTSPACDVPCITVDEENYVGLCDGETSGIDNYSIIFSYENGNTSVDYSISVNAGTVNAAGSSDPNSDQSGAIIIDDIPEGTDLEVTFTSTECGIQMFYFASEVCEPEPELVINEIMYDPGNIVDSNLDGLFSSTDDEFIELYNSGESDIDMSDWVFEDNVGPRHTFPSGTILKAGTYGLVFGGGTPDTCNFPETSFINVAGGLALNNGEDEISIYDNNNNLIAFAEYSSDPAEDESFARNPDFTGNFEASTGINGEVASPGRSNTAVVTSPEIYTENQSQCMDVDLSIDVAGDCFVPITVNGDVIATINPNGNNLGKVSGAVYIAPGPVEDGVARNYMRRTIFMTPETQGPATVRFYFTDADLQNLITDSSDDGSGAVTGIEDINITKIPGEACNAEFPADGTGFIAQSGNGTDDIGNYVEFEVTSFSAFASHGGSSALGNSLPIELLSFDAVLADDIVNLKWTTATELNNDRFEILASTDGENFETIGTVMAQGNSNVLKQYDFVDNNIQKRSNAKKYYRLKQIDYDGKFSHSDVKFVQFEKTVGDFTVFPNPVAIGDKLFIQTTAAEINLYTVLGQQLSVEIEKLDNEFIISTNKLQPGNYLIRTSEGGTSRVVLF